MEIFARNLLVELIYGPEQKSLASNIGEINAGLVWIYGAVRKNI